MVEFTRRQILGYGSGIGLVGASGCLQGDNGESTPTEETNGEGAYEQWLVAPGEVAFGEDILFTSLQLDQIRSHGSNLSRIDTSAFERSGGIVPVDEVEYFHSHGSLQALTGTFEAEPIESQAGGQFETTAEYGDYTTFITEGSGAIAVKDGVLLKSLLYTGADVRQNLHDFIDTAQGTTPRLQEVDQGVGTLLDHLGNGTAIRIDTSGIGFLIDGATVAGSSLTLGSEDSAMKAVVVFESEQNVDTERVATHVVQTSFFEHREQVSTSADGRAVTVQGSVPTQELQRMDVRLQAGGNPEWEQPGVWMTMDYRANSDHLLITHNGGEPIRKSSLKIRGSEFADVANADITSNGSWSGDASGQVDGEPAVVFGDTVVVGVEAAYDIRVRWTEPGGGQSATLESSRGPDAL